MNSQRNLPEPREHFLAVGLVRRAHGLHGEIRVHPLVPDSPRLQPGRTIYLNTRPYVIVGNRPATDSCIIALDGVLDRSAVEGLTGVLVEAAEEDVERDAPDSFFLHELIGLRVETDEGVVLGTITEILQPGANDVYVVTGEQGEILVPAIQEVVLAIEVDSGRMVVRPMPGMVSSEVNN